MKLTLFALLFALLLVGSATAQIQGDVNQLCQCENGFYYYCYLEYNCGDGGIGPGTLNCPGDCGCQGAPPNCHTPGMAVKPRRNDTDKPATKSLNFTPIPPAMRKPTVEQLAKLREASLSAIQKATPNCHAIAGVKLTAHGPVMPPPDNPPGNDPCVCWNDINYLACALGYLTPCW